MIMELLKGLEVEEAESEEPFDHIVVGTMHQDFKFPGAKLYHHPNAAEPKAIIITSPGQIHIFDYHSVDYCFFADSSGEMIRKSRRPSLQGPIEKIRELENRERVK